MFYFMDDSLMGKTLEHHQVWTNPWHFIAFGFGSGLLPIMPGTYGTLVAIPFYFLLQSLGWPIYVIMTVIITVFGVWLSEKVSNEIGIHDYPGMNFDEIVGYLVTMLFVPPHWFLVLLGFGLFRLFDIWKPWPIRLIDEQVKGGVGVILDDVVAGLFSLVVLQITLFLMPSFFN